MEDLSVSDDQASGNKYMLTVGSSHPEEESVKLPDEKIVKSTSSDLM